MSKATKVANAFVSLAIIANIFLSVYMQNYNATFGWATSLLWLFRTIQLENKFED